jgi:hypothetical protein
VAGMLNVDGKTENGGLESQKRVEDNAAEAI